MVSLELPDSLAQEIDRLAEAGHKQFTTYVAELLGQDVRLNRERKTLLEATGAWSDADHPELEDGGAAYVEKIRSIFDVHISLVR